MPCSSQLAESKLARRRRVSSPAPRLDNSEALTCAAIPSCLHAGFSRGRDCQDFLDKVEFHLRGRGHPNNDATTESLRVLRGLSYL